MGSISIMIWSISIGLSFFMKFILETKFLTDVFESGLKIDINNMQKLANEFKKIIPKTEKFKLYIPIYNVVHMMNLSYEYLDEREFMINYLKSENVLVELTSLEKEEYKLRPSLFTAISIIGNSKFNNEEKEIPKVHYQIDDDTNDINIILNAIKDISNAFDINSNNEDKIENKNLNEIVSDVKNIVGEDNNHYQKTSEEGSTRSMEEVLNDIKIIIADIQLTDNEKREKPKVLKKTNSKKKM